MVGLLLAGPASAATTIILNPAHRNQTAAGFETKECNGPLAAHPAVDGWHFVLPSSTGDEFVSVTLTYSTPGGSVTVGPITSEDPSMPTMGAGWSGFLDSNAVTGKLVHAYVYTIPGWTLLDGTALVDPNTATGTFNLSNTCPATILPSALPVLPSQSVYPSGGFGHAGVWQHHGRGVWPSGGARTGGGGSGGSAGWFGITAAFFVSIALIGYLARRRLRQA